MCAFPSNGKEDTGGGQGFSMAAVYFYLDLGPVLWATLHFNTTLCFCLGGEADSLQASLCTGYLCISPVFFQIPLFFCLPSLDWTSSEVTLGMNSLRCEQVKAWEMHGLRGWHCGVRMGHSGSLPSRPFVQAKVSWMDQKTQRLLC